MNISDLIAQEITKDAAVKKALLHTLDHNSDRHLEARILNIASGELDSKDIEMCAKLKAMQAGSQLSQEDAAFLDRTINLDKDLFEIVMSVSHYGSEEMQGRMFQIKDLLELAHASHVRVNETLETIGEIPPLENIGIQHSQIPNSTATEPPAPNPKRKKLAEEKNFNKYIETHGTAQLAATGMHNNVKSQ